MNPFASRIPSLAGRRPTARSPLAFAMALAGTALLGIPRPAPAATRVPILTFAGGFSPTLQADERGGIFIASADGTLIRQVTTFTRIHREVSAEHGLNLPDDHPSISPDGTQVAFTSNRAERDNWDLYVMNLDGTNVRRLTFAQGMDTEPAWSPDGTTLVFATERFGASHDLALIRIADRAVTRLTTDTGSDELEPAFSPDGTWIAYTRVLSGNDKDIFLIRPDGTQKRQVTFTEGEDHDASWSPEGRRLVLTSERFGTSPYGDVTIISTNGAVIRRVTTGEHGGGDPAWSPDGARIAFFHSEPPLFNTRGPQQVATVLTNGTGLVEFPKTALVNVHPSWGLVADSDGDGRADFFETGNRTVAQASFGLSRSETDGIRTSDRFGIASAVADIDRNGLPELLVGSLRRSPEDNAFSAGAVFVVTTSPVGLVFGLPLVVDGRLVPPEGLNSRFFSVPPLGNGYFGRALAAGDFDHDGFREGVIGAPGMNDVFILGGRPVQIPRLSGGPTYGAVLAVGDFNRDGRDDLVVGAPGNSGLRGSVHVHFGSASGITQVNVPISEETLGSPRFIHGRFGSALAVANLLGDAADDLVISAPGSPVNGVPEAGIVHVIPGRAGTAAGSGAFRFDQARQLTALQLPASAGGVQTNARFGEVLTAGRYLSAHAFGTLVVGTPNQDLGGRSDVGLVALFRGDTNNLLAPSILVSSNLAPTLPARAQSNLGIALTTGDMTGDGVEDLALSSRFVAGTLAEPRSGVFLIPGTRQSPSFCFNCSQRTPPPSTNTGLVPAAAQVLRLAAFAPDRQTDFGLASHDALDSSPDNPSVIPLRPANVLATGDLDLDGQDDLVIGIPEHDEDGAGAAGMSALRFGGVVGILETSVPRVSVPPDQEFDFSLTWTHPVDWTLLESLHLRISDDSGTLLWARLDPATASLALLDEEQGTFGPAMSLGSPGVVSNPTARVDLGSSTLTPGLPGERQVSLRLRLSLAEAAACRPVRAEILASDLLGQIQGWDLAQTIDLGDCLPRTVQGALEFKVATRTDLLHRIETAPDPLGPWSVFESFRGDGRIRPIRIPFQGTAAFFRVQIETP